MVIGKGKGRVVGSETESRDNLSVDSFARVLRGSNHIYIRLVLMNVGKIV